MTIAERDVTDTIEEISVDRLVPHASNPRVDVGDIEGMVASIKEVGVIEPLIAVRHNGTYQVVAGIRRLAAAKKAGLETVPVIAREMSDDEAGAVALIENLQRHDLAPLEEARGYQAWITLTGRTQADLARAVGKAPSTIANALRILEAPLPIRRALEEKRITPAHARVALEIRDPSLASALPLKAGVSVDDLQDAVHRKNAEYDTKGEGARKTLRDALAAVKAKYPNATITWKAGQYDVVSLIATLGQPPAKIAGPIVSYGPVTLALHDKACTCRAYQLDARQSYNGGARKLVTTLDRVCVDAKGYRVAKPKEKKPTRSSTPKAKAPKPLTPEQLAKKAAAERKKAESAVTKELATPTARTSKGGPIFAKLRTGTLPIEVARAIAYVDFIADGYFGSGVNQTAAQQIGWDRITAMPAKKVSALAAASVAERLEDELVNTRHWARKGEDPEAASRIVAAHFGVKVAEPKAKKVKR